MTVAVERIKGVITYTTADWCFDSEAFSESLWYMSRDDIQAASDLLGVSFQTVRRWQKGVYDTEFNHPRMSHFLNLCNLLDLDPRDYFTL